MTYLPHKSTTQSNWCSVNQTQPCKPPADSTSKSLPGGASTSSSHVSATSPSPNAAEQTGEAGPVKADVLGAGAAKRLSRFGQDMYSAAVAVSPDVKASVEQHSSDRQHASSTSKPATTPQPALPTALRLSKAKQGLGRSVTHPLICQAKEAAATLCVLQDAVSKVTHVGQLSDKVLQPS